MYFWNDFCHFIFVFGSLPNAEVKSHHLSQIWTEWLDFPRFVRSSSFSFWVWLLSRFSTLKFKRNLAYILLWSLILYETRIFIWWKETDLWLTLCKSLKSDSYLPKNCFICFNESPLKMMKNAFYLTLKALFFLQILKFLSWLFGDVEETAWVDPYGYKLVNKQL